MGGRLPCGEQQKYTHEAEDGDVNGPFGRRPGGDSRHGPGSKSWMPLFCVCFYDMGTWTLPGSLRLEAVKRIDM